MRISRKKNKGFTLVEVIVSMLVLSITISSVLTAFSLSAKSNAKTKRIQGAESLMEDLLELAGAVKKSSEYAGTCAGLYSGTATTKQSLSNTQPVEIVEITGVQKGSYTYKVVVTRDTQPAKYSGMNNKQVLSFGASGSKSAMIDASLNGNDINGDGINDNDYSALDEFYTAHINKVAEYNAALPVGGTPLTEKTEDEVKSLIDRDILLEAVKTPEGEMELAAYMCYTVPDSLELPDTVERTQKTEIYRSAAYHMASDTTEGAEKLDRIYLLYSPWADEDRSTANNYDVRIVDKDKVLGADVFLVYQEDTKKTVDSTLLTQQLSDRFNAKDIKVYFGEKSDISQSAPYRVDLYSSAEIKWTGSVFGVTAKSHSMISETAEIRVEELTIKIFDAEGNELASGTAACLQ